MMQVILVRHAETEWNIKGIIQGQSDSALTPRGERQTSALLAAFAVNDYRVDCVYTSPLGRAWQMGQRLADHFRCPLIAEPALKEQAFGQFEGMLTSQLMQQRPHDAHALFTHDAEYCPPEGESLAQATRRVTSFIHNLQETAEHQRICIVTHGQVSQGVLAVLKEGTIDNFSRYSHPNASYAVFDFRDGKCLAIRWGIATHLLQLERQNA
ncbi:histidine phosphatase family protein [Klebsiella variicola]|uniref:histidine phosphatase family protein n=1 Tax=Klebsiella variicola TaxID=244366 RepID=UPI000C7CB6DE|nr:histidine phosphatase family protein [Klebsiella variicola]PLE57692.1 histidine phosphatase family protein [Klebsiella variicola]